jgi:uncharacterized protein YdiU (UPF0061 family)
MSSLIKSFYNNKKFHDFFKDKPPPVKATNIRFTKVLTKFSTEYNNAVFIQMLCQRLGMDKKDLFGFFMEMKNNDDVCQINQLFENYEVSKLDINRMHRYLDKYTKENVIDMEDISVEADVDSEEV